MSDSESFAARWSRRKRASAQENGEANKLLNEQDSESAEPAVDTTADAPQGAHARSGSAAEPQRSGGEDTSPIPQLPPIESIVAESDVRAFLAPGVPPELTRAALRRAWSANPKIRDFIGLSENSWDFNDPNAMPGFGPLELTDALRREIARMIGRSLGEESEESEDATPPSPPDPGSPQPEPPPTQAASPVLPPPPARAPEPQADCEPVELAGHHVAPDPTASEQRELPAKRRHGSALPQ
jgi:hypothetical protein